MRKTWTIIFILTCSVMTASGQPQAINHGVFQILVDRCPHSGTLTGFGVRTEKTIGIVTALHGVLGCHTINALVGGTATGFNNLGIVKADIERDVALLSSSELQTSAFIGMETPEGEPSYEGLYTIGHPLGVKVQLPSRHLMSRGRMQLGSFITDSALYQRLMERNSPRLDFDVLSIEGHLLPGHSGAPILNATHQIVGVANGGLQDGLGGIVWAIPWVDIQWVPLFQMQERLSELAQLPESDYFHSVPTQNLLRLRIAVNDSTNGIIQEIYANRSAQYLVPISQNMHTGDMSQTIVIFDSKNNQVLGQGALNTTFSSPFGEYIFAITKSERFFILDVIPKIYYEVLLLFSSGMTGADIFVDGEPALVMRQTLTSATIRVAQKQTNHHITIMNDEISCTTTQFIRENNLKLYPCQHNVKKITKP